jgi:ABC-type cobalamin/Fe3+-siderophores transport system ATPase subunit
MDIILEPYKLTNLSKINIILGKNGCGKSTILRCVNSRRREIVNFGSLKLINPERGGFLIEEPNIEKELNSNPSLLTESRNTNQQSQFKQQSIALYRMLQDIVARELEGAVKDNKTNEELRPMLFDSYIDKINSLLEQVEIKRHNSTFKIYKKGTIEEINSKNISSGESELISLGIEALAFSKESILEKTNILLLDEPDVHLHPDLQVKLIMFLKNLIENDNFIIIIATHSTAMLGALENYADTHIEFMTSDQKVLEFKSVTEVYKKILPVFGAHPLSNLFNEAPVFLVEGEDDERIWQQAVRTSIGAIKIYPCPCGSIEQISNYETEVKNIIKAVYNNAKAYSLRDSDGITDSIEDDLPIIKFRLICRNAENLLLSDEVLTSLSINWEDLKNKIDEWLVEKTGKNHPHFETMKLFKEGGYNRKDFDIKEIRNDIMGIIGSSKPWEVAIGQAIGNIHWNSATDFNKDGSILSYLGEKLTKNILIKI